MPKSKRLQRITLSKSSKKLKKNRGLELKQDLVKKIRSSLDECTNLFVIRLYNERTSTFPTIGIIVFLLRQESCHAISIRSNTSYGISTVIS